MKSHPNMKLNTRKFVDKLIENEGDSSMRSRYPIDQQATELAQELVGDGKTQKFFVSIGNEFIDDEPNQIGDTYSIGMFEDAEEAELLFRSVELSPEGGPAWVSIEGALGEVKMRYLRKKIEYVEDER